MSVIHPLRVDHPKCQRMFFSLLLVFVCIPFALFHVPMLRLRMKVCESLQLRGICVWVMDVGCLVVQVELSWGRIVWNCLPFIISLAACFLAGMHGPAESVLEFVLVLLMVLVDGLLHRLRHCGCACRASCVSHGRNSVVQERSRGRTVSRCITWLLT